MANIKELSQKIVSLKNTQKVTRTMKLVSNSKLRLSQLAFKRGKDYKETINHLLGLVSSSEDIANPLFISKDRVDKILIVVFSSDKGLCGGFNNNLLKSLEKKINVFKLKGISSELITVGNRAYNFCSKRFKVVQNFPELSTKINLEKANSLALSLKNLFLEKVYDEIYLSYNQFESILKQNPSFELYLILKMTSFKGDGAENSILLEPSKEEILNYLLPESLNIKIFMTLLENSVGEHAARMAAMDSATNNGERLTNEYTLLRNRVRQSSITTELTEIVAGAESLN